MKTRARGRRGLRGNDQKLLFCAGSSTSSNATNRVALKPDAELVDFVENYGVRGPPCQGLDDPGPASRRPSGDGRGSRLRPERRRARCDVVCVSSRAPTGPESCRHGRAHEQRIGPFINRPRASDRQILTIRSLTLSRNGPRRRAPCFDRIEPPLLSDRPGTSKAAIDMVPIIHDSGGRPVLGARFTARWRRPQLRIERRRSGSSPCSPRRALLIALSAGAGNARWASVISLGRDSICP